VHRVLFHNGCVNRPPVLVGRSWWDKLKYTVILCTRIFLTVTVASSITDKSNWRQAGSNPLRPLQEPVQTVTLVTPDTSYLPLRPAGVRHERSLWQGKGTRMSNYYCEADVRLCEEQIDDLHDLLDDLKRKAIEARNADPLAGVADQTYLQDLSVRTDCVQSKLHRKNSTLARLISLPHASITPINVRHASKGTVDSAATGNT
jgi:hypothetical protein